MTVLEKLAQLRQQASAEKLAEEAANPLLYQARQNQAGARREFNVIAEVTRNLHDNPPQVPNLP